MIVMTPRTKVHWVIDPREDLTLAAGAKLDLESSAHWGLTEPSMTNVAMRMSVSNEFEGLIRHMASYRWAC